MRITVEEIYNRKGSVMKIAGQDVQELAQKYGTPLYVYDFNRIAENAGRLLAAFQSDRTEVHIFYAMKANCHPAIVRLFQQKGSGMDCVSPEKILYTGNYESYTDLAVALMDGRDAEITRRETLADYMSRIRIPD